MRFLDTPRERAQSLVMVLALALTVALAPFAAGLLGAVILEVLFAPAQRQLRRHMPPRAAAALVTCAAAVLVLLPVAVLLMLAIDHAPDAIEDLRRSRLLARLAALHVGGISVGAELERASGVAVAWISRQGLHLFGSLTHAALDLVIALFGLYYLLLSGGSAWRRFRGLLPFSEASAELLRERFRSVTEAMLLGIALTAVVQGAVVAAAFHAVGLPDASFWGVVTAFVSIFPLLGSATVWLPGVLVLLASERYGAALVLLLIGAGIASSVDNVIRPMVYRRMSHIHPMTTIVGAFAGVAWLGVTGLLFGPLALSYFFELLRIYQLEYAPAVPAAPRTRAHRRVLTGKERTPVPVRWASPRGFLLVSAVRPVRLHAFDVVSSGRLLRFGRVRFGVLVQVLPVRASIVASNLSIG